MMLMDNDDHFKESTHFKPARWLRDPITKNTPTKDVNPFAFLPFGFGTRSCVGRRFAEMEIMVLMTRYGDIEGQEFCQGIYVTVVFVYLFPFSILRDYRIEWHHGEIEYTVALISAPSSDLKFKFIPLWTTCTTAETTDQWSSKQIVLSMFTLNK